MNQQSLSLMKIKLHFKGDKDKMFYLIICIAEKGKGFVRHSFSSLIMICQEVSV